MNNAILAAIAALSEQIATNQGEAREFHELVRKRFEAVDAQLEDVTDRLDVIEAKLQIKRRHKTPQ